MHIDLWMAVAGLIVGFVVGLTGMGGGALMTPILVIFFHVAPLAAVSSDLVASLVMKPVGGTVHLRRGTVNKPLVGWLSLGSVPAAFGGVFLLRAVGGNNSGVQREVKLLLGVALLIAAAGLVLRALLARRAAARGTVPPAVQVRPVPTLLIGVVGGLIVGMTSVGSGSLIIVALLFLYPGLTTAEIVGTDLVQAVPLVGSAALGHLLFGDFRLDLTTSVLVGALPGVYLGARCSAAAAQGLVRRALVAVLLVSALKLLNVGNAGLLEGLALLASVGLPVWALVRHTDGFARRPQPLAAGAALGLLRAAAVGDRDSGGGQERWRTVRRFGGRIAGPSDRQADGSLSGWLANRAPEDKLGAGTHI
ncbi:MAG TPA: sulfite exporter TauE/SafE family protein [Sporichthyaceae bacterium]|nr:sulfite exporter TauE/SafE family protein [Sporichthyaceae bacterium]